MISIAEACRRKGKTVYESIETVFDYHWNFAGRRGAELSDSAAGSGQHIRYGAAVCASADRRVEAGCSENSWKISDRNHAGYVCAGWSWSDGILGRIAADAYSSQYYYSCCSDYGNGGDRKSVAAYYPARQEGRKTVMNDFFMNSAFAGVALSLISYYIGMELKKKFKIGLFNPLLVAIVLTILVLLAADVDYDVYNAGAKYLSWLLTPATVCLAIPLYEQFELLKANWKAVIAGIVSGVITSLLTVFVLSFLMDLSHQEYVTLLPKSITTAIGMGISEELGGHVTITVAVIIITGVIGNIFAETICKIFHIKEPIAQGLAIGTAAHAVGTAKAMEIGEIEGAMSSLSIAVAGILTVIGASVFAQFL